MPRPTALGVHIYSGAFTLGVSRRFRIVGQWEEGPWGAATFELNFPGVPHPLKLGNWPRTTRMEAVNFVYANPPCAPWSVAGGHLGLADPRVQYTRNCMDLALALKPEVYVVESVCRAWSPTGGLPLFEEYAKRFLRRGYAVTILLTNALLAGGPQYRERFHFIAHKHELNVPEPTIGIRDVPIVRDLIGDIEHSARWIGDEPAIPNHVVRRPTELDLNVLKHLQPDEHWYTGVDRARAAGLEAKLKCRISMRISYDTPSRTMLKIEETLHPAAARALTLREGARLCGYPDDFVFAQTGGKGIHDARSADVTQSVLPQMGKYLAGLAERSLDSRLAERGAFAVIDNRKTARLWSPGRYARALEAAPADKPS